MSDFLTIRGAVAAVEYEAVLKPAPSQPRDGQEREWQVTATGLRPFAIPASQSLVLRDRARAVIELELERRLLP